MPNFKPYNQNQSMLLPPDVRDYLPKDHLAYLISDVVDHLNITPILETYLDEGAPSFNPSMMTKVMFYAYAQGTRSSRKIENKLHEDLAFRYLSANQTPDHGTINLFRKNHLVHLEEIFAQIAILCGTLNLANLTDASIDGTKVKASASRDNLLDEKQIGKIKKQMHDMLEEAQKIDDEEDKRFGNSRGYNQLPPDLSDPEKRKKKIKEIQEHMQKLNQTKKLIKEKQKRAKGKEEQNQINNKTSNTTDPDAKLLQMKDNSFKMAYNVQIAASRGITLAYDIANTALDTHNLKSMIQRMENNTQKKVNTIKADAAYFTKDDIQYCNKQNIDAYIPDTRKKKEEKEVQKNNVPKFDRRNFIYSPKKDEFICPLGKPLKFFVKDEEKGKRYRGTQCHLCPQKSECTKSTYRYLQYDPGLEKIRAEMRQKLNSDQGKQKYLERMSDVEPVIGDIKENKGFIHFLTRGKPTVLIELGLVCTACNLVKIFNWIKKKKELMNIKQLNTFTRVQTAP